MSGKHAKILPDHQLKCLQIFACNTRNPVRDRLIVLLSVKAGLRAGEIARGRRQHDRGRYSRAQFPAPDRDPAPPVTPITLTAPVATDQAVAPT
jgi:integrase